MGSAMEMDPDISPLLSWNAGGDAAKQNTMQLDKTSGSLYNQCPKSTLVQWNFQNTGRELCVDSDKTISL